MIAADSIPTNIHKNCYKLLMNSMQGLCVQIDIMNTKIRYSINYRYKYKNLYIVYTGNKFVLKMRFFFLN